MTGRAETGSITETTGRGGRYVDPLWRIPVALREVERELLRSWWVRRLAFVAHAGAASLYTTQTYSRLEHSLGLLALVAHFDPEDEVARVAALLHDVGHLPLSHTLEGLDGEDHHQVGALRVRSLSPILTAHGIVVEDVMAVISGQRRSPLSAPVGILRLDHLDSFVRSGQAHGRTEEMPAATLRRLRLIGGSVSCDEDTRAYLGSLILAEARFQTSSSNLAATGLLRRLTAQLKATNFLPAGFPDMTDPEYLSLLLRHEEIASTLRSFLRDPGQWAAVPCRDGDEGDVRVQRLYLDQPLVNGQVSPVLEGSLDGLPQLPATFVLHGPRADPC